MNTRQVMVQARDGSHESVVADLLLCLECEKDGPFFVYVIDGQHLHFQCSGCEETFCDGSCTPATG